MFLLKLEKWFDTNQTGSKFVGFGFIICSLIKKFKKLLLPSYKLEPNHLFSANKSQPSLEPPTPQLPHEHELFYFYFGRTIFQIFLYGFDLDWLLVKYCHACRIWWLTSLLKRASATQKAFAFQGLLP